jgi:predicted RNA-binding Zn-ribbon protein involved in translation (DUF1610 family)
MQSKMGGLRQTTNSEEAKKCPKCGEEMAKGKMYTYGSIFNLRKPGDWFRDGIQAFYCKNCGYIKFYKL